MLFPLHTTLIVYVNICFNCTVAAQITHDSGSEVGGCGGVTQHEIQELPEQVKYIIR